MCAEWTNSATPASPPGLALGRVTGAILLPRTAPVMCATEPYPTYPRSQQCGSLVRLCRTLRCVTLEADGSGDPANSNRAGAGGTPGQQWPWPNADSVRPGPIVPTAGIFPESETEITPVTPHRGAAPGTGNESPAQAPPVLPAPDVAPALGNTASPPDPAATRVGNSAAMAGAGVGASAATGSPSATDHPAATAGYPAMPYPAPTPAAPTPPPPPAAGAQGRWGTWAGFFFVTGITTLTAFAEVYLVGSVGWITGAVFVIVSALSALLMRRRDLATAVITPPLAFLIAVAASAQPAVITAQGNLLLQESSAIITAIAFNAPWVFAGTGLALVIALVKGARFHRMDKARHMA